eukprot:CAMPEP_0174954048 /NCGR_PEP_ID=MMETSP0004_2-20121128/208_1 /TAXON_ID=420556 /ORGANISM="Ochromonas sp., Strain CCMP1393" /LENGTH=129 /DNA_ID=CAMNT_0016201819 /DNA_START=159 /DNA_END=545 /DNA_ORIENTATION=-
MVNSISLSLGKENGAHAVNICSEVLHPSVVSSFRRYHRLLVEMEILEPVHNGAGSGSSKGEEAVLREQSLLSAEDKIDSCMCLALNTEIRQIHETIHSKSTAGSTMSSIFLRPVASTTTVPGGGGGGGG